MIRFAILGLTLSLLAFVVLAEDRFADGWSVISGDGKVRSSDCIGSNKTMACTIDTVMACGAWSFRRLHDEAGARYYSEDEEFRMACLNNWVPHYFNAYDGRAFEREGLTLFYNWRAWEMSDADNWSGLRPPPELTARKGDWVVEIEGLSCALDQLVDGSHAKSTDTPWLSLPDCARRQSFSIYLPHYGATAVYPEYVLVLRGGADSWRVVDIHSRPGDSGSTITNYHAPERWLRK